MGNFLSPSALKVIAEDIQQGFLDRPNEQIKGAYIPYIFFGSRDLEIFTRAGQAQGSKTKALRRLSFQPQRTRAKRSHSTMRAWRSTTHFFSTILYVLIPPTLY